MLISFSLKLSGIRAMFRFSEIFLLKQKLITLLKWQNIANMSITSISMSITTSIQAMKDTSVD